jgi:hypothetical protein
MKNIGEPIASRIGARAQCPTVVARHPCHEMPAPTQHAKQDVPDTYGRVSGPDFRFESVGYNSPRTPPPPPCDPLTCEHVPPTVRLVCRSAPLPAFPYYLLCESNRTRNLSRLSVQFTTTRPSHNLRPCYTLSGPCMSDLAPAFL